MIPPPSILDGAQVLKYAMVDDMVQPTRACIHRANNVVMKPAAALAIGRYEGEEGYYLFHCDATWNVIADTWHPSWESAVNQAEFEYSGIAFMG